MIQIEKLCKSFGDVRAVDDLSLSVPEGELFCFLGPNGAGKTTTIRMLAGLMHPDRGTIRVGGIDVLTEPVEAKRILGYIPDMPYLYGRLTPIEFLHFVGDLYNVPRATIEKALEDSLVQFGLTAYRDVLISDLSHGLRQRLTYVATFLHEPRVLLIDEPLVGLDPYTIRMIKNLLRSKTRAGMTILLTTHILSVAEEIADRIGIIAKGSLIALGNMQELVKQVGGQARLEDVFLKLTEESSTVPLPTEHPA